MLSALLHLKEYLLTILQAQLAFETGETPVGCVFVHNGTIIGRGMNATNRTFNGTRHAEFEAVSEMFSLNQKTRDQPKAMKYNPEILKECDLYVTVEPCIMCASMLRQFGIGKVYFGASNDKFGGTGGVLNIHRANGKLGAGVGLEEGDYEISGGWLREEAIVMLRKFYVQENGRGQIGSSFLVTSLTWSSSGAKGQEK